MYRSAFVRPEEWGSGRKALGWALVLVLASGAVTAPEVWAATYYVDATSGDDGRTPAQAQNSGTPWETLTHALANVASGDRVEVAAGAYDTALGESYPLELVSGVTVHGADKTTTTLRAPAGTPVVENVDTPLAAGTTLTGFTLTHENTSPGQTLVHFAPTTVAMAPTIDDNIFDSRDATEYGLVVDSDATSDGDRSYTGTISNNTFDGFYEGIYLSADLEASAGGGSWVLGPTVSGNHFTNTEYAIDVELDDYTGESLTDTTKIVGNVATGSRTDVYYYADFETGSASTQPLVSGNTFTGAGEDSIYMSFETLETAYTPILGSDHMTASPTITNNTIDTPAGNGVDLYYSEADAGSVIAHVDVSGNEIIAPGTDGIYLEIEEEFYPDGDDTDLQFTIANNSVTEPTYDGIHITATSLDEEPYLVDSSTTIAGNVIDQPGSSGIIDAWNFDDGGTGSLHRLIAGNTVTRGDDGDGIFAYGTSQSSLDASDLVIRDNVVDDGFTHGIHIEDDAWPEGSQVLATCNTVTNNSVGFVVSGDSTSAGEPPDLGGGGSGSPGLNSLFDNSTDLEARVDGISAQSNWWGTTSVPTILSHIGGAYAGGVDFSNFLSGPPTVTATNELTASLAAGVITYTATIEGTGECGCAGSSLNAPTPTHTVFVPESVSVTGGIAPAVHTEDPLEVWIGALGAGEMVTVSWQVQVDTGYTGPVSEQATFGFCPQLASDVLSDDPDTPAAADPTVIDVAAPVEVEVPALGPGGMVAFVLLLLLAAGAVLDRRRRRLLRMLLLGLSLAAGGLPAAAAPGGPQAVARPGPAAAGTTASPAVAPRLGGRTLHAATVASLATRDGAVRLALSDGTDLTVPQGRVRVLAAKRDDAAERGLDPKQKRALRGRLRAEAARGLGALRAGQAVVVKVRTRADGSVQSVLIRPTPDLATARAVVARAQEPHRAGVRRKD